MIIDKLAPQAIDLEEAVLGALMLENRVLHKINSIITGDSFYKENHRKIFDAISSLAARDEPVDILTVTNELKKDKTLDIIGGPFAITSLTERVASSAHAEYHALIIQQKYLQRKLIEITSNYNSKAFDPKKDVFDLINELQGELLALLRVNASAIKKIDEVVSGVFEIIDRNIKNQGDLTGIGTGFTAYDKFSNGLQSSDLIIIAGETSQGKTSLALNICNNAAIMFNKRVGIYSLEMSESQLGARLMSQVSEISSKQMISGKLNPLELEQLNIKIRELVESQIYIDECSSTTLDYLINSITGLKIRKNIDLVVIDYLQLISNKKQGGIREQEVADIARRLKNLAKELHIPIILISQLRRDKNDHKPTLSRLRDSGQIEEAADVIWLVYRPDHYGVQTIDFITGESYEARGHAHMIIAKGRNIGTTEFILKFNKRITTFSDSDLEGPIEPGFQFEELKKPPY